MQRDLTSRIMLPVLWLAVILSASTYLLDEYLVPKASDRSYALKQNIAGDKTVTVQPNVFFRDEQGAIIYAGQYDTLTHSLGRVMLYESEAHPEEPNGKAWTRLTLAFNGRFEGDQLILSSGHTFLYNSQGELVGREEITEVQRPFPVALQQVHETKRDASTLAGGEIAKQIARSQEVGQDPVAYETDLQFKYSTPVACFIFSFVGFIFSVYSPRKETFVGMLYAIILVLFYYVLISVFKSLGKQGIIPYPVVSAWSINVLYLIFGIYVFARTRR